MESRPLPYGQPQSVRCSRPGCLERTFTMQPLSFRGRGDAEQPQQPQQPQSDPIATFDARGRPVLLYWIPRATDEELILRILRQKERTSVKLHICQVATNDEVGRSLPECSKRVDRRPERRITQVL